MYNQTPKIDRITQMKNTTTKNIIINLILCIGCSEILDRIICISNPQNNLDLIADSLYDVLIILSGINIDYVLQVYLKKQTTKITYVLAVTAWTQFIMAYYLYNDSNDYKIVIIGSIIVIIATFPTLYYLLTLPQNK